MQIASGSLVIINAQKTPIVFWSGQKLEVVNITMSKRGLFIRVKKGTLAAQIISDMIAAGIKVKEVK